LVHIRLQVAAVVAVIRPRLEALAGLAVAQVYRVHQQDLELADRVHTVEFAMA
jgi:hypothetical protein